MYYTTGATKRTGAETAAVFAHEGALVEGSDLDERSMEETLAVLKVTYGNRVHGRFVDVTRPETVVWHETVMARHGRVDAFCNNAEITAIGPLHTTARKLWNRVLVVNLTGVYEVSRGGDSDNRRAEMRIHYQHVILDGREWSGTWSCLCCDEGSNSRDDKIDAGDYA